MDRSVEKQLAARAVALGRALDGAGLVELCDLLRSPSAEVRRLAASAIGKLAGLADPGQAVSALLPLLRDRHGQVRQYTVKALCAYGTAAQPALADLRDLAVNSAEKPYNRRDAGLAVGVIEEALRIAADQVGHKCQRCSAAVTADEYARSRKSFQRVFCDKCFDEVYLDRRNFDTKVDLNKTIRTQDGTLVQSAGERDIADYLARRHIIFRYDERIRIVEGYAVRPDFYLPEFDVYIEYWGMDTADYKIGMLKKQKLYQQEGKQVVSLYPSDLGRLADILGAKLSRYVHGPGIGGAEGSQARSP